MHIRLVKNRSAKSGKQRRYAQLVQSYRRSDGVPAHRVVANLGELDDREVENLKLALKASRSGKSWAWICLTSTTPVCTECSNNSTASTMISSIASVEFQYKQLAVDGTLLVYTATVGFEEILDARVTSEELRDS